MSGISVDQLVRLVAGVTVLLVVTAGVHVAAGVRMGAAPYVAVLRGGVQLAVIGAFLHGILDRVPAAAPVVLLVMLATATWTASRRLTRLEGAPRAVLLACTSGALVSLVVVFALGVLPFAARYVIALGGIVLGGTMTSASLAGRSLLAGLVTRREEVEGWLALGATPRRAVVDIARSAGEGVTPPSDPSGAAGGTIVHRAPRPATTPTGALTPDRPTLGSAHE